jgi:cysteine-rich repeat protein
VCNIESGFNCHGGSTSSITKCIPITGDGILVSIEECDDGNLVSGDGCSISSLIEIEYKCENKAGRNPISICR